MKAAIRKHYGSADQLEVKEVPLPVIKDDQYLIKVQAATVNRTDMGNLTGYPFVVRFFTGFPRPRNASTGCDFAGVVEQAGKRTARFKKGDKVWGFDDNGLGSHAQYVAVNESTPMALVPDKFTFAEAVSCAEGAHYAFNFINKLNMKPGQHVLLNGATGAIGSASLQLLKHMGMQVTAVCDTANIEKIMALGPDRIIDYKKEDFTMDAQRYHYVCDAVGKSTYFKCRHLLHPGGVYISSELGPSGQNIYMSLIGAFHNGKKVKFPLPLNIQRSLDYMMGMMAQGAFKPLIDRSYPISEIREAFQYVGSGQKIGNVILRLH